MSSPARNNPGGIDSLRKPISLPLEQITPKRRVNEDWEGLIDQEEPIAHHMQPEVGLSTSTNGSRSDTAATRTAAQPMSSPEIRARESIPAREMRLLAGQVENRNAFDQSPTDARLSTNEAWAEVGDGLDSSLWRGDFDEGENGLSSSMGSTRTSDQPNLGSSSARLTDNQEARRRRLRELRRAQGVERKATSSRRDDSSLDQHSSLLRNGGANVVSPNKLSGPSLSHYDANKRANLFERQVCTRNTGTYRSSEWGAGGGGKPEPLGDRLHAGNYAVSSEAPTWMTQIREEHKPETLLHHKNAKVRQVHLNLFWLDSSFFTLQFYS